MATLSFDPTSAVPDLGGEVIVDALGEGVTIVRDRFGIPHVNATSPEDGFVGQGFATAQDRLWQLELDRRRAAGTVAEVLGGADWAITDSFHRRLRVDDAARTAYAGFDDATRRMIDAHTAGVNAFLATSEARPIELQALGIDPEPWEPWQTVAVFLGRHVGFATWQLKLFRARAVAVHGPDVLRRWHTEAGSSTVLIVPPGVVQAIDEIVGDEALQPGLDAVAALQGIEGWGQGLDGSNAWLVSGERTASGAPLLAGDPHRLFELPNVYYQCHLRWPGVDAAGFSFAGVPGLLHFGQNDHVAWGVTNAMAEYQDLFVCRFDADGRYQAADGWREPDRRTEVVEVRGGEAVEVTSVVTHHGAVVVGDGSDGVAIALRSSGLEEPGGSLRSALGQLTARSVDDLDAALVDWVEPVNSFMLADRSSIRYRMAGRVPVRPEVNGWLPVPGWDDDHAWQGWHADDSLPREHDPEGGAIVTGNNRLAPLDHPVQANVLPAGPHRAVRIWELLGDRTGLTVDDMAAIHNDAVCLPLLAFARSLERLDPSGLSAGAASVREQAVGWDGVMSTESPGAAAAAAARHVLLVALADRQQVLAANPFAAFEPPSTTDRVVLALGRGLVAMIDADDRSDLPTGSDWATALTEALEAAHGLLVAAFGADPSAWCWGGMHRFTPRHVAASAVPGLDELIEPLRQPVAGDRDCVRSTASYPGIDLEARHGAVARYVFDLGDRRRSGWVAPHGASGHPASAHHADQLGPWIDGSLVPVLTDDDEIARDSVATQRLRPGPG